MRLAFDVGMHNGDDTDYFRKKGFRVVAVEAMPTFVESAAARFHEDITAKNVILEHVGIAEGDGEATFFINPKNTVQSSFVPKDSADWQPVKVRTVSLSTLLQKHGTPDLLKIDIENYDLIALDSLMKVGAFPKYISCEAHRIDVVLKLWAMGYRRFRLINGRSVPRVFGKRAILDINGAEHIYRFRRHSSGPYGNDISEFPWVDIEKIMMIWSVRREALGRGWFDIHAALPETAEDMFLG